MSTGGARPGAGAPKGNVNGLRHGLRGDRKFPIANLPRGFRHISEPVLALRRYLEQATYERYGQVSLTHESLINLIVECELNRQMVSNALRKHVSQGELDRGTSYTAKIQDATVQRHKAMAELRLDEPDGKAGPRVEIWASAGQDQQTLEVLGRAESGKKGGCDALPSAPADALPAQSSTLNIVDCVLRTPPQ